MSLTRRLKVDLFGEPRRGRRALIPLGFGLLVVALGIVGNVAGPLRATVDLDPRFVVLGIAFVLMGGAEWLPRDQSRPAGLLRIASIAVFVLYGIAIVRSVFTTADGGTQLTFVFYTAVLLASVAVLWVAGSVWRTGQGA